MPSRKPSLWWALSPLAYEIAGGVIAVAGFIFVEKSAALGGAAIVGGVLVWARGFNRVRRADP